MTQPINRQWLMARRPAGDLTPDDFRYTEGSIPDPGDGEVLLRTLYFGYDATQRLWMTEDGGYMDPVAVGDAVRAMGIAQVVKSRHPDYKTGDLVDGFMSWQDYVVVRPGGPMPMRVLPKANYPLSWNLGMFGVGGLTAYFGTVDVLRVQPGDTVVVSAATGATGHVVGGIAKAMGAKKVIGFAGDADKCRWIVESGHYDAAINYKTDDIPARLRELCPDGVDDYYDNVGGDILDEMFLHMKQRGRMVICGAMSQGYVDLNFQGPALGRAHRAPARQAGGRRRRGAQAIGDPLRHVARRHDVRHRSRCPRRDAWAAAIVRPTLKGVRTERSIRCR